MKFLDEAKIYISSGAGGHGCLSFRREKFIAFGGPDGGNGGNGASVIFRGSNTLNTLIDYRYRQHFKGRNGQPGMGKNRTGKSAEDIYVPVPLGTEIIDEETGLVLVDLVEEGQEYFALTGGRGGRGNASYASSTNRTPRQTTEGEPGQELAIRLRLKLLADVGLLGLPNAGKSTFISSVSNARPKVADYPFTTLKPNLGVVRHHQTDFVIADLPGLIAGAHEGTGLGHKFLQHVSRCSVLLHLVDGTEENPGKAWKTIQNELEAYDEQSGSVLAGLPQVIALSKTDAMQEDEIEDKRTLLAQVSGQDVFAISSHSKAGLDDILTRLAARVKEARDQRVKETELTRTASAAA